jgi:hypothetical protein
MIDDDDDDALPGKFLHRVRRVSPTGDMARTTWRLLAHLLT